MTYCLKELRALIIFADAFSLPLTAKYGDGGDPIVFSVESPELVTAGLIMATLCPDPEMIQVKKINFEPAFYSINPIS